MTFRHLGRAAIAISTLAGGGGAVAALATNPGPAAAPAPAAVHTAVLASATTGGSTTNRSCPDQDRHWPVYVQGRPDGFDARDDGAYMWHNPTGGWGIRVTHPVLPGRANRVVFTGLIRTQGYIGHVVRVRDEADDVVRVVDGGHALAFRFVDYGGVDGVDFTVGCTSGVVATFKADHTIIAPRFVHLGDRNAHPGSDPFLVRHRDADKATVPAAG